MEINNIGRSRGRGRGRGNNSNRNNSNSNNRGKGRRQERDEKVDYSILQKSSHPIAEIGLNLSSKSFSNQEQEIVDRAFEMNVKIMILTGTSERNSSISVNLAKKHSLYCTVGVHPHGNDSSHFWNSFFLVIPK